MESEMQLFNRLSAIASAALLAACGGGGSDHDATHTPPSLPYNMYEGNANKHVVLDGASTQFAVKSSNQKLVHLASGNELNQLLVAEGGNVMYNGQKIAAITLTQGTEGKKIAVLTCTGPAPNYGVMTISITHDTWSYRCASNTGNTDGNGSGDNETDYGAAQVRNHCVRLEYGTPSGWRARNYCSESVRIQFCYVNPENDSWASGIKCSNNNYGTTGKIPPGGVDAISSPGNRGEYSYRYIACVANEGRSYLPFLSNQGQTGVCRY